MRMVAATLMFCCAANVQAAGDETNGHAYFTKACSEKVYNVTKYGVTLHQIHT